MRHAHNQPCVYILASGYNGTLYIGVTSGLLDRVSIHNQDLLEGFTKRCDGPLDLDPNPPRQNDSN